MPEMPFSHVVWGMLFATAISVSCGKDRSTKEETGQPQGATTPGGTALEEITPENHVPLDTYRVRDYAIENFAPEFPLSAKGQGANAPGASFTQSQAFQLADSNDVERFYVGHPITISASMGVDGGAISTVATFGLIQKPADGASEAEIAALHTCMLGNVAVTHGGATSEGKSQSFHGSFNIPDECLPEGKTSEQFHIYMAVDVEGSIYTGDETASRPRITVLDAAYIKENNICLRLREDGPCLNAIQVDASPGVNIRMLEAKAASSVATFDAFFDLDAGDTPNPLASINSEIVFEGLKYDNESAKEYEARLSYSLCATSSADWNESSCSDEDWADLLLLSPKSENNGMEMNKDHIVDSLTPDEPKNISSTLFARDETLAHLKEGGKWADHKHFLIRTCIDLFRNGERVEQKNITTQAAAPNGRYDDCRYIQVLMSDVRKSPEAEGRKVCTDADGNLSNKPIAGEDCIPANEVGNSFTFADFQNAQNKPQNYDLSESTKLEWGKSGLLMMRLSGGVGSSLGVKGASYESSLGLLTDGFWRIPIRIFDGSAEASIPLNLQGKHAFDLSMFGLKIFSRSGQVNPENPYNWSWEPSILGAVKKARSIARAKKYDETTRKYVSAAKPKAPTAIAVKEYCQKASAQISFIRVSLELCAEAGIYLDAGYRLNAKKVADANDLKELPGSVKFAKIEAYFIPSAGSSVIAAAYASVILARAGVEGIVTLIDIGFPARTYSMWGQPADESSVQVRGNVGLDIDFTWLDGRVVAFADIRALKWCKAWFLRYPCGLKWSRLGSYQFVSFRGGSANYTLYNKVLANTVIPITTNNFKESLIKDEEL